MIKKWIRSKTYRTKNSVVSFIKDVKKDLVYVLKDEVSEMWQYVIENEKVIETSVHNNNQMKEFLLELKKEGIIETNEIENLDIKNKYLIKKIDLKTDNSDYFNELENKLLFINNFIGRLYLELNYACNLNCKHCCNPKNLNQHSIDFENAKKIIDEALELGLSSLVLTGGECSTNKDFLKIAKYARSKYIELDIMTNGQNLYDNSELFDEIVSIYPSFYISLYSMDPETHDKITKVKGSWKKTTEIIKKLREKNLNVTINCMILSYNYHNYKDIEDFANEIGANFIKNVRFINNKDNNNLEAKLSEKQIEDYYFESFSKDNKRSFSIEKHRICNAASGMLSITPNLGVTPCTYLKHELGNFKNTSLKEIFDKEIKNFTKDFTTNKLEGCFKEEYCKYCMFCPVYASFEDGYMKKAEILCEDARAYYNALQRYKQIESN